MAELGPKTLSLGNSLTFWGKKYYFLLHELFYLKAFLMKGKLQQNFQI